MKLIIGLLLTMLTCVSAKAVTNITFVGASITRGAFIDDPQHNSFPGQLQSMLGEEFKVSNLGVNGCTMLKNGDSPYWNTNEYQQALKSNPDVVFIDLGGNDSKLINRKYLNEINQDCQEMIETFRQLPSKPRVIVMLPIVSFVTDTTGIWDPAIVHQVIPGLLKAAYDKNAEVLDMHPVLLNHEKLMPDKIHPDKAGSAILSKKLYNNLVQPRDIDFDIFKKLPVTAGLSSFHSYQCVDFVVDGRNCKVVKPKITAKGHPWIWRTRFWGHEAQTEIALLERGFHVVYCNVAELFGNDESIEFWNHFYKLMQKAELSKKSSMIGMSRGGVYALNWSAKYPKRVSAIYIDNPLLDMKSWPCGLGRREPSPNELEAFKLDYNITTTEQLEAFNNSPIDKIDQIVKGHYPILILCADADEAALPDENTLPFEKKIIEAGGQITVMHKPGFKHHPHSFPNPEPIVEFILNATRN